jgi:hypothetical protein
MPSRRNIDEAAVEDVVLASAPTIPVYGSFAETT